MKEHPDEAMPGQTEGTMMRRAGIVAAAILAALVCGAAEAQTTPADPLAPGAAAEGAKGEAAKTEEKPERAKPKHHDGATFEVVVHNDRSVGMKELKVGPAGEANLKKVVGPLAFGRKVVIHLKRTKDCLYDIHGEFADDADTDQTGVDLCKDKAINLTD
jgi:hypothetical protein